MEYLTPGQYIVEEEADVKIIETAGSSNGCVIGEFERGQLGKPVMTISWVDFLSKFGNSGSDATLSAKAFFDEGGTRLYVIRVGGGGALSSAVSFKTSPDKGKITFSSKSEGTWGNALSVSLTSDLVNETTISSATVADSKIIKVPMGSWKSGQRVFHKEGSTVTPLGIINSVTTTADGLELNLKDVINPVLPADSKIYLEEITFTVKMHGKTVEVLDGLVGEETSVDNWARVINLRSKFVHVSVDVLDDAEYYKQFIFAETVLAGGTAVTTEKIDYLNAIEEVLPQIDDIAIVFAITESDMPSEDTAEIFNKVGNISVLNGKKFFNVCYIPTSKEVDTDGMIEFRNKLNSIDCNFLYQGYLRITDSTGARVWIPPSGVQAGAMSKLYSTKGYWNSPAGLHCMYTVQDVSKSVTDGEQALLNPVGINCVRHRTGIGTMAWGARNLTNDKVMRYISDRVTFTVIGQTILKNNIWTVFRNNDHRLWDAIGISLTSYLSAEWKKGALRGSSEGEAFKVRYGSSVTDGYDVMTGKCHIELELATQKPAEFVIYHLYPIVG